MKKHLSYTLITLICIYLLIMVLSCYIKVREKATRRTFTGAVTTVSGYAHRLPVRTRSLWHCLHKAAANQSLRRRWCGVTLASSQQWSRPLQELLRCVWKQSGSWRIKRGWFGDQAAKFYLDNMWFYFILFYLCLCLQTAIILFDVLCGA